MPNKTDRILSYLPGTFRAPLPVTGQASALYAIANAAGGELQQGENKLAEVMLSHWVDTADRNAAEILDLANIASLYGLAPQPEEELEEFRRHLKRYVRTFLEGTVTVQGILRVAAEALGLEIADSYDDLDTWWKRSSPELVQDEPDADDAAMHVLGFPFAADYGEPAKPARVLGKPDLTQGADLRAASLLYLQVDSAETETVQLIPTDADPRQVSLKQIVSQINSVFEPIFGRGVASAEEGHLVIVAPSTGPSSRLEFEEGPDEAGDIVLGLPPLTYFGRPALAAAVIGSVDLSGDLDLRQERYLRIAIDGGTPVEVDCGGATPGHRTAEEVRDAVNAALGFDAASLAEEDGAKYLRLESPSVGHLSAIAFLQAPAQDAALRLFGPHTPVSLGSDETRAEVFSPELPAEGVDLSVRFNLRLSIDDSLPVTVNCAGLRPAETQLTEIANAINAAFAPAFGGEIARRIGRRLRLISPTTGSSSQLRFETPDEADATELLFGLPPRTRRGSAPTSARLVGKAEIDEIDLLARHLLQVRLDGGPPVLVDLSQGIANPRKAILQDVTRAVEQKLGDDTATDDGLHLILASTTTGGGSSIEVLPLTTQTRRRHVSRAIIAAEASQAVLGVHSARAEGQPATRARLVGTADLSRGVDLRQGSYLRLSVDGLPFKDILCAGPRPRATLIGEVLSAINAAWQPDVHADVAFTDGKHLILVSPSEGQESSLGFEPPLAYAALDTLLGLPAGAVSGSPASGVTLVGLPDLSAGVDLPAGAAISIGLDGAAALDILLTGDEPAHLALSDLVVLISLALGSGVASHDGTHLILKSSKTGAAAQLELALPSGSGMVDVTAALFGFSVPRSYQGADAQAASLIGQVEISGELDLTTARFLRIGVDGAVPVDIDCAADDPSHTDLDDILTRINAALKADVASKEGDRLKLQSTTSGISSRLVLERYSGGDARQALFGSLPTQTTGAASTPATLTGTVSLTSVVDLSQRSILRLSVDGGLWRDIDLRGSTPAVTLLSEIVARINDVFPGLASAGELDQLRLTSPTVGPGSSVEVLPLRTIELIEYLPQTASSPPQSVLHGSAWYVDNKGVGDAFAQVRLEAPSGACSPMLVNQTIGWDVQLFTNLRPGETIRLWTDPQQGLVVSQTDAAGLTQLLSPEQIFTGPLGGRAQVPFPEGTSGWALTGSSQGAARLVLDNPLASRLLSLHSFLSTSDQPEISVQVNEAEPVALPDAPGDGSPARLVGRLVNTSEGYRLEGPGGDQVARLRNGLVPGISAFADRVVAAEGPYFGAELPETLPLLVVEAIDCLFNVTFLAGDVDEAYTGVTIGSPADDPHGLAWQVNAGAHPSSLVRATVLEKSAVLSLPQGRSHFRYLDCLVDRFNYCVFGSVDDDGNEIFPGGAHFAGGTCSRRARFNLSCFAYSPPEHELAVFDSSQGLLGQGEMPVQISLDWVSHQPGVVEVRLPADLPARFGGRFNLSQFSRRSTLPELFENTVTEPGPDEEPRHMKNLINAGSQLVVAEVVERVPLGWSPQQIPFRKPRLLTLGSEETPARIYLQDPEVPGFIELRARSEGAWGNAISVAVRKSGPAFFDVSVAFNGARFDSARETVAGPDLPELVLDILKPAPVGVRLAKAAGVSVRVTRAGVEDQPI